MKYTLKQLEQACKKKGCTLECDSSGRWNVYQICAPKGKIFDEGIIHYVVQWPIGQSSQESLQDGIERIGCTIIREMTEQEKFECDEE